MQTPPVGGNCSPESRIPGVNFMPYTLNILSILVNDFNASLDMRMENVGRCLFGFYSFGRWRKMCHKMFESFVKTVSKRATRTIIICANVKIPLFFRVRPPLMHILSIKRRGLTKTSFESQRFRAGVKCCPCID